jgi:hypothetical protein
MQNPQPQSYLKVMGRLGVLKFHQPKEFLYFRKVSRQDTSSFFELATFL